MPPDHNSHLPLHKLASYPFFKRLDLSSVKFILSPSLYPLSLSYLPPPSKHPFVQADCTAIQNIWCMQNNAVPIILTLGVACIWMQPKSYNGRSISVYTVESKSCLRCIVLATIPKSRLGLFPGGSPAPLDKNMSLPAGVVLHPRFFSKTLKTRETSATPQTCTQNWKQRDCRITIVCSLNRGVVSIRLIEYFTAKTTNSFSIKICTAYKTVQ